MDKQLILIVDDNEANRYTLRRQLERAGYQIIQASDGTEAIELAARETPDMAIIDIGLPDISGYEVGRRIKEASSSLILPVLHISASYVGTAEQAKGLDSGADAYLTQPIEPIMLLSTVGSLLRIRKAEKELDKRIQELRRNKADLERTKSEAEEANRAKSRFLANMSHEIRTPLGAILGFVDLLKDPGFSAEEKNEYLEIVRKNGLQLNALIDDILDLSKVEAGKLELSEMKTDLTALLEDVANIFTTTAKRKNIALTFHREDTVPGYIFTDSMRLKQVLINLIGNALKFTEQGVIDVIARRRGDKLEFEVRDTGIGIATEHQPKLFQPFQQADSSMTRKFGGTGLGLSLSKKIAQTLHGDLWLEKSEPGKGSVFIASVRLRESSELEAPTPAPHKLAPDADLSGVRILVVEDVEENRMLLRLYLRKLGLHVELAENGQDGVAKALTDRFDLILMDLQMPVMDGADAMRRLRDAGYEKPIVALTAHALKEDRDRCLEMGFTDYLSKPINFDHLLETICRHAPVDCWDANRKKATETTTPPRP